MIRQLKITKIWAVGNLKGLNFDDFRAGITDVLNDPNCSPYVAFLEVGEVWEFAQLQNGAGLEMLHQRLNKF